MKNRKFNKLFYVVFIVILMMLSSMSIYANSEDNKVVKSSQTITIDSIKNRKVIKTENFKQGNSEFTRNYTTDTEYFISSKVGNTQKYFVSLRKLYTVSMFENIGKKKTKNYVKIYEKKSSLHYFISEYDIKDTNNSIDNYFTEVKN